ncbi:MAG: hypothetical protein B5M48_02835 [Candidatus Omnitrophica bacterium 4484_213]|nr:MAG: hypothetical protein B5M48_02835 [Candidatus Omnitrophica bacterium 4484_213]
MSYEFREGHKEDLIKEVIAGIVSYVKYQINVMEGKRPRRSRRRLKMYGVKRYRLVMLEN